MSKKTSKSLIPSERIEGVIYVIREQKVILDQDLATLYGVETRTINQAISRKKERFPDDFLFRLNKVEWKILRSQSVISSWGGRRYPPIAFTEQGVAMLSSVLRSPQAVTVNIEIMRVFVRMRHVMASQQQINKELSDVKSFLLKHSNSTDREFRRVWQAIEKLSEPPTKEERQIGFKLS